MFTLILPFQPYYLNIPRSRPGQNINWIGEGCDRLGKPSLTSLGDYHWATARIRVNSSSVKGGIISSSLFCWRRIQYCRSHRGMAVLLWTNMMTDLNLIFYYWFFVILIFNKCYIPHLFCFPWTFCGFILYHTWTHNCRDWTKKCHDQDLSLFLHEHWGQQDLYLFMFIKKNLSFSFINICNIIWFFGLNSFVGKTVLTSGNLYKM